MNLKYIFLLFILANIASCSDKKEIDYNFEGVFQSERGGRLIDAMSGEPSNLISMIAGDSAS